MTAEMLTGESDSSKERMRGETKICPFLGFEDDPETALAYPSPFNFCYHCKPISPVNMIHQRDVCLAGGYPQCPVYQQENLAPFPKGLRGNRPAHPQSRSWVPFVVLILVLIASFIIFSLFGLIEIPGLNLPVIEQNPTETLIFPPTKEKEITQSPTAKATDTPKPTETATIVQQPPMEPRAIGTPFGENPKLVIHQLLEGEGYIMLAEKYNTTIEAIQAINYNLPEPLWVNTMLVIPINTDEVTGLPQFTVREITTEGLTIEDYAQRMQLDAALLKQFNALPDGYLLKIGELIIIPN